MNPTFIVARIELISSTFRIGSAQTHRLAGRFCGSTGILVCSTSIFVLIQLKGVCAICQKIKPLLIYFVLVHVNATIVIFVTDLAHTSWVTLHSGIVVNTKC